MNSPQTRILMVEDDETLSSMLGEYLSAMDMRLSRAATAEAGLRALKRDRFDALILDVMLPDLDGFEVCRRVRRFSDIPILMLTARGDAMDRIVGLERRGTRGGFGLGAGAPDRRATWRFGALSYTSGWATWGVLRVCYR